MNGQMRNLFSAYVRVHLWCVALWRRKQHQSTKLSACVSDRPKKLSV